jgi:hypothetical protein
VFAISAYQQRAGDRRVWAVLSTDSMPAYAVVDYQGVKVQKLPSPFGFGIYMEVK